MKRSAGSQINPVPDSSDLNGFMESGEATPQTPSPDPDADPRHPRVRIALFSKHLAAGGSRRALLTLARGFLNEGFAVDLILSRAEGPLLEDVPEGTRLVNLKVRRALSSLPALVRYLRQETPDAMLTTQDYVSVVAIMARRWTRLKFPLVVREANTLSENAYDLGSRKDRRLLVLMRRFYPQATSVVANSEDTRNGLIEWKIARPEMIRVIPNPLDIERIQKLASEPVDQHWFNNDGLHVILSAGRLIEQKDFETLIKAFNILWKKRNDVRLVILGEGHLRRQLEDRIHQLGLESRVLLPGFVHNPFSWMAGSSVFVLSSAWEGSPNVVSEALACGVPVVATTCPGGAREVISDRKWGRIVPVADPEAMASAIDEVLASPPRTADLLERARLFSLSGVVDRYLEALGLLKPYRNAGV